MEAPCSNCRKKTGARLGYRLDPGSWRKEHRLLCASCRSKLGFWTENFRRKERVNF